ncbi:MAG TPA: PAS domain-containing sensor histidine kinase [Rhizomicrobium sp.]|nr:PAS domain-containing sensor histidine kinase [Rhizomicrobium sp.]
MLLGVSSREHQTGAGAADGDLHPGNNISPSLAVFALGLVIGLGLANGLGTEFFAGLVILAVLSLVLALLGRANQNTRKRLTAGEASYRAFFEHAVEGIFRTTAEGHYLAVNPALAEIYGYGTPEQLMSRLTDIGAQLYVDSGRRDEFRALMQANDVVTDFVSEIYHQSGKRIWISENARAVRDWSGALICYEGTVEDVTQKFEADRALRAALRQAELANRAKAAFLAAMSHELKTPLNAVLGFSEIIRDDVRGKIGQATYRDYAGDIHASGKRLLAVINDVLDVSRIEGGQLTIETHYISALDIAEQAIAMAFSTTGENRAIVIDVPAHLPTLRVDPRRLVQALGNLVANAIKFTPSQGRIAIAARIREDGGVNFAVADSGIGMMQETIAAALEPFRQLDASLARKFEGAGLGLTISRALTELHGGSLSIASAVGKGTTVTIALPSARSEKCALSA